MLADTSVKGSQFKRPLLEFSGACAGCAETSYAKLVTQLFGDRMYITNATGCSSIWGGPRRHVAVHGEQPKDMALRGQTRLFEDNAEHGLGMLLGHEAVRDAPRGRARRHERLATRPRPKRRPLIAWPSSTRPRTATPTPRPSVRSFADLGGGTQTDGCPVAPEILANKEYLAKKSVWIFGGDGWAYDIGYGGLDHVLASGKDVNVLVFDTEVYSNTGGQASKASNIGQVAQFAAAGKDIKKKDLAEIAMSYGYVYVAQVAMGADPNQTFKAIARGRGLSRAPPSSSATAPCDRCTASRAAWRNCQAEMKKAVDCRLLAPVPLQPAAEGSRARTRSCWTPRSRRAATRSSS